MANSKSIGRYCLIIGETPMVGEVVSVSNGRVDKAKIPAGTVIDVLKYVVIILPYIKQIVDLSLPIIDKIIAWWKKHKESKKP